MKTTIAIDSPDEARALLGINDRHARLFRQEFNVAMTLRGDEVSVEGEEHDVEEAVRLAEEIIARFRRTGHVGDKEVALLLSVRDAAQGATVESAHALLRNRMNRSVAPRTPGQRAYVEAMEAAPVVFAIGPAGTGKTYLAVAMAVRMLRAGEIKKLILTRPAVEAGEKLGFLPGTFEAKVDPYLRPLYDAIYDLLEPAQIRKFAENDVIEVAPLAYMRGRTLSDAYIILDEAQNTTVAQMKMFLTRMGEGSRMVVTGDITQVDLPTNTRSGLVHASSLLRGIEGIRFCGFGQEDIVRHPVVQDIVDAYEREGQPE
jgi:phosphate starvation-inducible PhoH-like protein